MIVNAVVPQTLDDHLKLLGDIPAQRVHIDPPPGTATTDDWLAAVGRGSVCELVDGTLVDKTMGIYESLIAAVLIGYFRAASGDGRVGITSGEQGLIQLAGGQCRAPDVAFFRWDKLPGGRFPPGKAPQVTPDIAVEVVSQGNTMAEMMTKRKEYFQSGTSIVWMVDPLAHSVAVYTSPLQCTVIDINGTLEGGDVLPDLKIVIADLFDEVDGGRRSS